MKQVSFIFAAVLLLGCNSKYQSETVSFNSLLNKYDLSIADNNHIYLLIPTYACHGCVQQSIETLNPILSKADYQKITLIFQDNELKNYIRVLDSTKIDIIYDYNNAMNYIEFELYNLTIVKTRNKRIKEIQYITPDNITELVNPNLLTYIRN